MSSGKSHIRDVSPELRALNTSFPTVTFTTDGEIIRANAKYLALIGADLPTLRGTLEDSLKHPDDVDEAASADLWDALRRGEDRTVRERRISMKGEEFWIEAHYCPLREEDGQILEVVQIGNLVSDAVMQAADKEGQIAAINALQAIVHYALDGTILDANERFLETMGYRAEEIIGRNDRIFVDTDVAESDCYATFWETLRQGQSRAAEFRRISKDGQDVWLNASYSPIKDALGRPFKIVKYATDVTRERQRQSEYEWQVSAIHKSHAVVTFDVNGTVLDANEPFLTMMGYSLPEIVGRHHRLFVEPAFVHSAEYAAFWKSLANGETQSGQFKRIASDRRIVWQDSSYSPVFDAAGELLKVVCYATEVTDSVKRQADHQGQIAAIHRSQGVIEFALDGTILDANENFLESVGYRLSEVIGRNHRMLVDAEYAQSKEYAAFWETLSAGEFLSGTYKRLAKNGDDIWLQATYNPILDMAGQPQKIIKYASDITQEKTSQFDFEGQIKAIRRSQCVVSFSLDGKVIDANQQLLDTFGYTLEDVIGQPHTLFVDEETAQSGAYAEFWDTLRRGDFISGRHRRRHRDGSDVWLQASYNPILDLEGYPVKIVKYAIDVTRDVELAEAYEDAKKQAQHDAATSLPNRVRLSAFMAAELNEMSDRLAVLYLDVDRFKSVNDLYGHEVGDKLLGEFADRLRRCLRGDQLAARVGGDEFVIAAPDFTEEDAEELCRKLIDLMAEPFHHDGGEIRIGTSIGVSMAPADGTTPDELLRTADMALYRSKQNGRGTYNFYSNELNERLMAGRKLTEELRRGIDAGEFFIEYQPRFDARNQNIRSAEALVRWAHPERGRVSPANFIPVAERSGLIIPLGEWIIRTACIEAASWSSVGVSVNVSPAQFRDGEIVALVASALEESGLPPSKLEIEITEGVLLEDAARARETLRDLKALGVSLAIDDFGTGYASLSYLRNFPFDVIKIDRQFIADLDSHSGGRAIVQAILALGRALGLSVTAEGVETAGQLASLVRDQCAEVQGYLLAHPMAPTKLREALERQLGLSALLPEDESKTDAGPLKVAG